MAVGVGGLAEVLEQLHAVGSVHVGFGHQRKINLVPRSGEVANFLVRSGFLPTELIAWETDHRQVGVGFMERLETSVLRRRAARAGDVDDQPSCAAERSERCLLYTSPSPRDPT